MINIKYTTVNHLKRRALGISVAEYCVFDAINFFSKKDGFNNGREALGKCLGFDRKTIYRAIKRGIGLEILQDIDKKLFTTEKWRRDDKKRILNDKKTMGQKVPTMGQNDTSDFTRDNSSSIKWDKMPHIHNNINNNKEKNKKEIEDLNELEKRLRLETNPNNKYYMQIRPYYPPYPRAYFAPDGTEAILLSPHRVRLSTMEEKFLDEFESAHTPKIISRG